MVHRDSLGKPRTPSNSVLFGVVGFALAFEMILVGFLGLVA